MLKCLFVPVTEIVLSDFFFFLPTRTVRIIFIAEACSGLLYIKKHKQEVDL